MLPSGPFPGKWTFFGLLSGQCDNCSAKAALLWCDQECLHARMHARNRRRVRDGELHGFVGGGSLPSFPLSKVQRRDGRARLLPPPYMEVLEFPPCQGASHLHAPHVHAANLWAMRKKEGR